MSKLKDAIVGRLKDHEIVTEETVRQVVDDVFRKQGIEPLVKKWDSIKKGSFGCPVEMYIYKAECPTLPENNLRLIVCRYGIDNKAMFYGIDLLEFGKSREMPVKKWSRVKVLTQEQARKIARMALYAAIYNVELGEIVLWTIHTDRANREENIKSIFTEMCSIFRENGCDVTFDMDGMWIGEPVGLCVLSWGTLTWRNYQRCSKQHLYM